MSRATSRRLFPLTSPPAGIRLPSATWNANGKQPSMKNAVTMHDVSARARVSLSTVSRVLNDHATVNPTMRKRVLQAVEELGYRPNLAARTLKTSRSRLIVFLIPEISNPYYTETYSGIHSVAEKRGYATLIYETTDVDAAVRQMLMRDADGVVADAFYGKRSKEVLASAGIPFVQTNAPATLTSDESSIRVDVFGATLELLRYLGSMGHKSIGIIDTYIRNGAIDERERAYRVYAAEQGITDPKPFIVRTVEPQEKYSGGYDGMRELIRRRVGVTATICHNDLVAVGAMAGARSLGFEVPHDLSIAGFDNARFSQYTNPPLTTVNIPTSKQGEIAAKMLIDLIDTPLEPRYSVQLQTELVVRESIAPLANRENVYRI